MDQLKIRERFCQFSVDLTPDTTHLSLSGDLEQQAELGHWTQSSVSAERVLVLVELYHST